MREQKKYQHLVVFSILFGVLTGFPLLSAFNHQYMIAGKYPLLFTYIFAVWGLFILCLWAYFQWNRYKRKKNIQSETTE